MTTRSERVSMPMGSAGIIGMGSDVEIEGIKVDPKVIIMGIMIFVAIVKIASIFIK